MAKILIVEDNDIQLNWANKLLGEHHTLISVKTRKDYFETSKNGLDLIITDLMIPFNDYPTYKDDPDEKYGLEVFLDGLNLLSKQNIKGLALISNYEHHTETPKLDNFKKESSYELLYSMKNIFWSIGKRVSNEYLTKKTTRADLWKNEDCLTLHNEGVMNIIFVYDLPFYSYSFFFNTNTKEILKRKDFLKGEPDQYKYITNSIKEGLCIALKPYNEIVNALGF